MLCEYCGKNETEPNLNCLCNGGNHLCTECFKNFSFKCRDCFVLSCKYCASVCPCGTIVCYKCRYKCDRCEEEGETCCKQCHETNVDLCLCHYNYSSPYYHEFSCGDHVRVCKHCHRRAMESHEEDCSCDNSYSDSEESEEECEEESDEDIMVKPAYTFTQ